MRTRRGKTIVVKVGSSTLAQPDGQLDGAFIDALAEQLCALREAGHRVMLVTSGAIRTGAAHLGVAELRTMPEKQAAAAIGQGLLMQTYSDAFTRCGVQTAQVLLTRDDISHRRRFLNARNTLVQLFRYGVVPILNENDTVVVEEIRFGDNDTLAARAAILVDAELLLLLSDVDGLYLPDSGEPIPIIRAITAEIRDAAGGTQSRLGTGGMQTKLDAAQIATQSGVSMVIANGRRPNVIRDLADGKLIGTLFPAEQRISSRKKWIAFGPKVRGKLLVNEGCQKSILERGRSLLAVGLVSVEGKFKRGDLVAIADESGVEFARGLVNYGSQESERIAGLRSNQIEGELGYKDFDEVVHRDNLVLEEALLNGQ